MDKNLSPWFTYMFATVVYERPETAVKEALSIDPKAKPSAIKGNLVLSALFLKSMQRTYRLYRQNQRNKYKKY